MAYARIQKIAAHLRPSLTSFEASGHKQIVIASVPDGPLRLDNFEMRHALASEPRNDEVLVQTLAITMGAGQRAGLQGSASYAGAARAGVVMGGTGVGRVMSSSHAEFVQGDLVMGDIGWQERAIVSGSRLTKVRADIDPVFQLGALGVNALTAYFGLLDVGAPQHGETVVVSAAGGSVGHIVGQIAKIKGCRVVGVAGSDEKCAALIKDLGFDAAVNYKSTTFREDFKQATPRRIDVYFDNTGGDVLSSALFRMNRCGRVVCCGNASSYDTAKPGGGPRGVPGLLVNNEVRMQGFLIFSYADRYTEARSQLSEWVKTGKIKALTTSYHGLENAPQAFVDMLNGATRGTVVVHVAAQ